MRRAVEWALGAVAVLLTGAYLAAVSGGAGERPAGDPPGTPEGRYFHAGKVPAPALAEPDCLSEKCHGAVPHAKDRTEAAFRNMHVRFVDCLVCHGKESRASWVAVPPGRRPAGQAEHGGIAPRSRWRLEVRPTGIDRDRTHDSLGPALKCRACHSDEGYPRLTGLGIRDLPRGFANPVALRMIEEGAKQWIPDTMR
ncbi:MAG: hypothetical protein ACM3NF_06335 [Gemmatimonadota bacterium]